MSDEKTYDSFGALLKAHVEGYTRSDGTFVKEHDDNRTAAAPAASPESHVGRVWNARHGERKIVAHVKMADGSARLKTADGELVRPEDLERQIKVDESQHATKVAAEKANAEKAEAASADKSAKHNLHGFTDGMSAVQREKVAATLHAHQGVNGVFKPRRQHIEEMVAGGAKVVAANGQNRLVKPDGAFHNERDITKTGMAYAAHLSAKAGDSMHKAVLLTGNAAELLRMQAELTRH